MVKEGIASLRCYVGQIQAIDERGRGLTLVDWFFGLGLQLRYIYFTHQPRSAHVAKDGHDIKGFGDYVGK